MILATFANDRAREQAERIVDYLAFPGLGLLVDPEGAVVIERGELAGVDVHRLAELITLLTPSDDVGATIERDVLVVARVPADHYGLLAILRADYRLCVIAPHAVPASLVQRHLSRARDGLVAMMTRRPSGDGGPGREANALWAFAVPDSDPAR